MKYRLLASDQERGDRVCNGDAWDKGLFPQDVAWQTDTLLGYWNSRRFQAQMDSYMGIQILKFPEDLRTYEHILWESKPEVIVEVGVFNGGSSLWFCDRMRTLYRRLKRTVDSPLVVGVDIDPKGSVEACRDESGIVLIQGDAVDKLEEVKKWVSGRRCMVIEDSEHGYDNTAKVLQAYHEIVSPGCYLVVEDTWMDEPDLLHPAGTLQGCGVAARGFLKDHPEFEMVMLNFYGLTCNKFGWLRRKVVQ